MVKLEDHDIRVPIFGMGGEVPIQRLIRILIITTTNLHDFETAPLAAILNQVNCAGKSVDG
jgi:hypothetical protein